MAAIKRNSSQKKPRGKGKPFKPDDPETGEKDERINRKGRIVPKDVQELNALIDEILLEDAVDSQGNKMQKMRVVINRLIMSKSPVGQIHILDRRYGKVKEQVDISNSDGSLTPKLPDEERLARMKQLAVMIAAEVKK